ncbi:ATP-grasp domain-containing protein [Nakamurella endophytica]|uniref:Carbamoyl phosphate synthase n=1 Tax=Nakamurella endophytica TaxID=1748367 RepID=A0A917TBV8_9ACTN|nr:ATP-grasp domain-containing protein [Nakamurella endophytica]GGM17098.1 carbamoyl phosphate synthase [Nakamurella endophytica]
MSDRVTVLVTGAGGPAGVAIIRSLLRRGDVRVVAADMDAYASGLYLVPAADRALVPAGLAPGFADAVLELCRREDVDVLFPTVDVELPVAARRADDLAAQGVRLASPSLDTLLVCLDKYALAQRCAGVVTVPRTDLLSPAAAEGRSFPVIVKPRSGAGSRGISLVSTPAELAARGADNAWLVQDHLPGEEYSVDLIAGMDGSVIAAVPRSRLRVDSGVSVAGRTLADRELQDTAAAVARAIGLTTVANIQLKRTADGTPALLEVNPRFSGAMPLTVASGVDMPSLTLDLVLGRPVPAHVPFREVAMVRYLEDVFLDPAEIIAVPGGELGDAVAAGAGAG